MFNAPLLGNGHCHGNRIMGDISGTWWDATTQVSSKSVHWYASYSVYNILQYGGCPPSWVWILLFWTTHEVNYAVRLPCQSLVSMRYSPISPPEILQFYNFAILAGKYLTTPLFWFFKRSFEPINIVGGHPNPQKEHPCVTTRHLSYKWLKSVQGFDLGGVARKKYNQDRTVFDCFWRMVHCTNRQKHSKPLVYQSSQVYQDCTNSVPTVYQSSKTVKTQSSMWRYHANRMDARCGQFDLGRVDAYI